jgi:hypothetical protein
MFNTKKKLLIQIWRNAARRFVKRDRNIIKMASRRPCNLVLSFRYGKERSFTINGMRVIVVIMIVLDTVIGERCSIGLPVSCGRQKPFWPWSNCRQLSQPAGRDMLATCSNFSNMFDILTVTVYMESGSRHDTLWGKEIRTSVVFSRDRRRLRNLKRDKFGRRRTINFYAALSGQSPWQRTVHTAS